MKAGALEILRQAEAERARERQREGWNENCAIADQPLWGPKRVLAALLDAHRMQNFIERRVGPARVKSGYPEFRRIERYGDYPKGEPRPKPDYVTGITFDRMEQVLYGWQDAEGIRHPQWQVMVIEDAPQVYDRFEAWIEARLRREAISALCRRRKWALRTLEWQRDKAAGTIAMRLNRIGVPVW